MKRCALVLAAGLFFALSSAPTLAGDVTQQQVDDAYNVMRNLSIWFQTNFEDRADDKIIVRDSGTFKSNFVINDALKGQIDHWKRQLRRSDVRAVFPRRALEALESRLDELKAICEDDWFGKSDSEFSKASTSMHYTRGIVRSIVDDRLLQHPSPTGVINDPNAPKKVEVAAPPKAWEPPSGLVDLPEVVD